MLPERVLLALTQEFDAFAAIKTVFLYGSYARGAETPHSDIDLALLAPEMTKADFARLSYRITWELPTLIPAEIVRLDGAAADFRERVMKKGVVIYERK